MQADRVERYLVVHGQILLNQIKAYPNQAVQRSQFVTGLKTKMEMRKHSKLYYTKKGTGKLTKGVQRNPMKVYDCVALLLQATYKLPVLAGHCLVDLHTLILSALVYISATCRVSAQLATTQCQRIGCPLISHVASVNAAGPCSICSLKANASYCHDHGTQHLAELLLLNG